MEALKKLFIKNETRLSNIFTKCKDRVAFVFKVDSSCF